VYGDVLYRFSLITRQISDLFLTFGARVAEEAACGQQQLSACQFNRSLKIHYLKLCTSNKLTAVSGKRVILTIDFYFGSGTDPIQTVPDINHSFCVFKSEKKSCGSLHKRAIFADHTATQYDPVVEYCRLSVLPSVWL